MTLGWNRLERQRGGGELAPTLKELGDGQSSRKPSGHLPRDRTQCGCLGIVQRSAGRFSHFKQAFTEHPVAVTVIHNEAHIQKRTRSTALEKHVGAFRLRAQQVR